MPQVQLVLGVIFWPPQFVFAMKYTECEISHHSCDSGQLSEFVLEFDDHLVPEILVEVLVDNGPADYGRQDRAKKIVSTSSGKKLSRPVSGLAPQLGH